MEARFLNCVRRAYLDIADLVHGEQEQQNTDGGELDGGGTGRGEEVREAEDQGRIGHHEEE